MSFQDGTPSKFLISYSSQAYLLGVTGWLIEIPAISGNSVELHLAIELHLDKGPLFPASVSSSSSGIADFRPPLLTPLGVSPHLSFSPSSGVRTGSGKSIFSGFGFCLIHSRTRVTLEFVSCRHEGIDMMLSIRSVITGTLSRRYTLRWA